MRSAPTARLPIAYLCYDRADQQELDPAAINWRCVDISKTKVDQVFRSVFGYSLMIDPTSYHGPAVRKSDANFRHDVIIEMPDRIKGHRAWFRLPEAC